MEDQLRRGMPLVDYGFLKPTSRKVLLTYTGFVVVSLSERDPSL